MRNKFEELEKLKALLDSGVLNKEEFESEKKKILEEKEEPVPQTPPSPNNAYKAGSTWEENLKQFFRGCSLDEDAQTWLKGKLRYVMYIVCPLLFLTAIGNMTFEYYMAMAFILEALLLGACMIKTKGILPKIIITLILIGSTYICVDGYISTKYVWKSSYPNCLKPEFLEHLIPCFFWYWGFIAIFNLLLPSCVSIKKRICFTSLLAIPLNPILWAMDLTGTIYLKHTKTYTDVSFYFYAFNDAHLILVSIALILTLLIIYCLLTGTPFDIQKRYARLMKVLIPVAKRLPIIAKKHKKAIIAFCVVLILIKVGSMVHSYHEKVIAEQAAIEKARKDSIAAVEQAERARKAAIEKARQDSIAAVEQA